jgi:deoxyribodipyrimidine photo-lyase
MLHLIRKKYALPEMEKLIQELAWRDYFQRVGQSFPDLCSRDLKNPQTRAESRELPAALLKARTGIKAIDHAIDQLYETGYMHNHCRMYVASLTCNIANTHWQLPAQWMYYHLLDADFASNACSWQWVAGSFSNKKYVADQQNINRYCYTDQRNTFLDIPYEHLGNTSIPEVLTERLSLQLQTALPEFQSPVIDPSLPVHIFTPYHLDPQWRKEEKANRILLLDPDHFSKYPMASRTIEFILGLSQMISGIQPFTGNIAALRILTGDLPLISKEHPLFRNVADIFDERDWMFPEVKGYHPSFFSFWKKCSKYLSRELSHQKG